MVYAGDNIQQLAEKRKKQAIRKLGMAGVLFVIPVVLYLILSIKGISIFIHIGCWFGGIILAQKGKELLLLSQRADRGAKAEKSTALVLSELEQDNWEIEYNVPLRHWGDADAFLCSPKGNCFVVDTKSNKGIVFFNGIQLMLRYGKNVYPFSNNKNILKAVRGQAVSLKEIRGLRFVTPILCFTKATLDIKIKDKKVENVYVLTHRSLVRLLRKLDK